MVNYHCFFLSFLDFSFRVLQRYANLEDNPFKFLNYRAGLSKMNFASYRDELMEIYRQTPSKFHIFVSIWVINLSEPGGRIRRTLCRCGSHDGDNGGNEQAETDSFSHGSTLAQRVPGSHYKPVPEL